MSSRRIRQNRIGGLALGNLDAPLFKKRGFDVELCIQLLVGFHHLTPTPTPTFDRRGTVLLTTERKTTRTPSLDNVVLCPGGFV